MIHWSFRHLLKKPKANYTSQGLSETEFCDLCHKPAQVFWIDEPANLGHGEPMFDGMHLECYRAHHGYDPPILKKFEKYATTQTPLEEVAREGAREFERLQDFCSRLFTSPGPEPDPRRYRFAH